MSESSYISSLVDAKSGNPLYLFQVDKYLYEICERTDVPAYAHFNLVTKFMGNLEDAMSMLHSVAAIGSFAFCEPMGRLVDEVDARN